MVWNRLRYDLKSVKEDLRSFFYDNNHRAFAYGSKAYNCNCDSIFYKKQIQVIFEEYYPHDVTGKAINELLSEKFLKEERRIIGSNRLSMIFIFKRSRRYVAAEIKNRIRIVEKYIDDEMNDGCGKQAESLFSHMFEKNQFKIIARDTNSYRRKTWKKSNKNLDFIIKKDGFSYGMEIKNTFDYMPQDEFEEKLEICDYLGLVPLFPVRYASPQQHVMIKEHDGRLLVFKTRIFPPGTQRLVTDIWNTFRLPVSIWYEISKPVENNFLAFHRIKIAN